MTATTAQSCRTPPAESAFPKPPTPPTHAAAGNRTFDVPFPRQRWLFPKEGQFLDVIETDLTPAVMHGRRSIVQ
jgi:hypothetical protein